MNILLGRNLPSAPGDYGPFGPFLRSTIRTLQALRSPQGYRWGYDALACHSVKILWGGPADRTDMLGRRRAALISGDTPESGPWWLRKGSSASGSLRSQAP